MTTEESTYRSLIRERVVALLRSREYAQPCERCGMPTPVEGEFCCGCGLLRRPACDPDAAIGYERRVDAETRRQIDAETAEYAEWRDRNRCFLVRHGGA